MTTAITIIGAVVAGAIGWLYGRRSAAQPEESRSCNTGWGGGRMGPWSGAVVFALFGALIAGAIAGSL